MRIYLSAFIVLLTTLAFAKGGGGHSIGGNLLFVSPNQEDMNTLIKRANTRVGGISTGQFSSAYELNFTYLYRFGGTMYAFLARPSYFWQTSKGSGTDGDYNYELSGYTIFPIFRMIPLENNFIKFFMHTGLGFGSLDGSIQEGAASVKFNGKAFGFMVGLGAEFCITTNHCINIEGNFRYLPYERNIASSYGGTFSTDSPASISQPPSTSGATTGVEVEIDDKDLQTTMSGIQGVIGYMYYF